MTGGRRLPQPASRSRRKSRHHEVSTPRSKALLSFCLRYGARPSRNCVSLFGKIPPRPVGLCPTTKADGHPAGAGQYQQALRRARQQSHRGGAGQHKQEPRGARPRRVIDQPGHEVPGPKKQELPVPTSSLATTKRRRVSRRPPGRSRSTP